MASSHPSPKPISLMRRRPQHFSHSSSSSAVPAVNSNLRCCHGFVLEILFFFSQGRLQSSSNCACFSFSSERVRVLICARGLSVHVGWWFVDRRKIWNSTGFFFLSTLVTHIDSRTKRLKQFFFVLWENIQHFSISGNLETHGISVSKVNNTRSPLPEKLLTVN